MIRKSFTYKTIKTVVALSLIVEEKWAGPTGRDSRPIPFKFRTTDYLSDTILNIPSFWSICIRIPCRIWADLCKIFFYLYQLRCDPFVFTWWMILAFYDAFAELAYLRLAWPFLADSPILSCADNISNRNGFGKVHLLLFNVQWDLD